MNINYSISSIPLSYIILSLILLIIVLLYIISKLRYRNKTKSYYKSAV